MDVLRCLTPSMVLKELAMHTLTCRAGYDYFVGQVHIFGTSCARIPQLRIGETGS